MTGPGQKARVVVTGMGVATAVGSTVAEFAESLRQGRSGVAEVADRSLRVGAFLRELSLAPFDGAPEEMRSRAHKALRASPPASVAAACVVLDAFLSAELERDCDPEQIAVVVGGNNIGQQYMQENFVRFLDKPKYTNPRYGFCFLDTHVVGAVSEIFGFRGPGLTTGATSASGNVALFEAMNLLRGGHAEICVCVGALADLGALEFRALFNLGALHPASLEELPAGAYGPFDRSRNGFFYGQGSGCLVLERLESASRRGVAVLGEVLAVSLALDGHHAAQPNAAGEARAMRKALQLAGLAPGDIDYLSAHGTGSPSGDDAECAAIRQVFGDSPRPIVNATKALTGHTIFAAGLIEAIAAAIQIREGFAHANPALEDPIDDRIRFAGRKAGTVDIHYALSNSFSFGGINSTAVLARYEE